MLAVSLTAKRQLLSSIGDAWETSWNSQAETLDGFGSTQPLALCSVARSGMFGDHIVVARIDNAVDDSGERLQGYGFLLNVFVPIVGSSDAWNDMAEQPLGMIGRDVGPARSLQPTALKYREFQYCDIGQFLDKRRKKANKSWRPLGGSNPCFQVENLTS
jgi:hypothetical protein